MVGVEAVVVGAVVEVVGAEVEAEEGAMYVNRVLVGEQSVGSVVR